MEDSSCNHNVDFLYFLLRLLCLPFNISACFTFPGGVFIALSSSLILQDILPRWILFFLFFIIELCNFSIVPLPQLSSPHHSSPCFTFFCSPSLNFPTLLPSSSPSSFFPSLLMTSRLIAVISPAAYHSLLPYSSLLLLWPLHTLVHILIPHWRYYYNSSSSFFLS